MQINDTRNTKSPLYALAPPKLDRASGTLIVTDLVAGAIHEGQHFHWCKLYQSVAAAGLADPAFFWPDIYAYLTIHVLASGPCMIEFYEDAQATAADWLTNQGICNRRVSESGTLNQSNFQVKLAGGAATGSATKLLEMYIGRAGAAAGRFGGSFAQDFRFVCKQNTDADPQLCYYLKCTSKEAANNISILLAWGEPTERE